MASKVINIGTANIDEIMTAGCFPQVGETRYTYEYCQKLGGKGANQAVAVSRAGAEAVFLGCLGMDANAEVIKGILLENRVNVEYMLRSPGSRTGVAHVWTDKEERNMIICCPGANMGNQKEQLKQLDLVAADGDIFIITLEYPKEFVARASAVAKEKGCTVIIDPSGNLDIAKDREIARMADIIKPNEVEAEQLTGFSADSGEEIRRAVLELKNLGYRHPIVSLGKRGCCSIIDDSVRMFETTKVRAVDTTGAGDAFIGYLAAMLSFGESLEKAIEMANAAASISTTKLGAAESVPFIEELSM